MRAPCARASCLPVFFLACLFLVPGCSQIYKTRTVRHTPVAFEQAETERRRPRLWVRYVPAEVDTAVLPFELPEQKGMLYFGRAVRTSYEEALSAYFDVDRRGKYADFSLVVNLDALELDVSYEPERPERGEPVTMRVALSHTMSIRDGWGDELARIVLAREERSRVLYTGPDRTLEMGAAILERMIEEMERHIFQQLQEPWKAGAFKVDL